MTIRESLTALYEQAGYLTPKLVVDTARDPEHPLHPYVFDRGPEAAAEAWYLHRAHGLIQSVRISYRTDSDGPLRDIRAFQAVRGDNERTFVYEPVEKVASDPVMTQVLLREMERDWRQLKARWSGFREFAELVRGDLVEAA